MKKISLILAALCAFIFIGNTESYAGNRPCAVTLSLNSAFYYLAQKRHLQNANLYNAALAYNFDQHWAAEGLIGFLTTYQRQQDRRTHGALYLVDGIYRFNPCCIFEPYVIAGIGLTTLNPNGYDSEHQGNINAGIGTQIFLDKPVALRVEARDIYTIIGGKNDIMLNLGLSFLM